MPRVGNLWEKTKGSEEEEEAEMMKEVGWLGVWEATVYG
jgi:hypothetical protein